MTALHVCLVSEQLPANLIPALKFRPDRVLLLASAPMQDKARTLRKVLDDSGIKAELWATPLADHDIRLIEEHALNLAVELSGFDGEVVFNATGGNKLMALAFWQTLSSQLGERLRVIYCDTKRNSIEQLLPKPSRESLDHELSLKACLAAYDYRIVSQASDASGWGARVNLRKSLSKWLARRMHHEKAQAFLGLLNKAANDATKASERNDLHGLRQAFPSDLWGLRLEAMREISRPELGLIDWKEGEDSLVFRGADAARYLCGGWLEEYAYHAAVDAGGNEVASGVLIRHKATETSDSKTDNELDAVVMHHNRLLILECKTASLTQDGKDFQGMLHKLDNVGAHAGGLMAERWLLSVREVPDSVRARARAYRIRVIEGADLGNLSDLLHKHFQVDS